MSKIRIFARDGVETTIASAGKYMHAFCKQRDGSWRYTHVIFNNDKPPA